MLGNSKQWSPDGSGPFTYDSQKARKLQVLFTVQIFIAKKFCIFSPTFLQCQVQSLLPLLETSAHPRSLFLFSYWLSGHKVWEFVAPLQRIEASLMFTAQGNPDWDSSAIPQSRDLLWEGGRGAKVSRNSNLGTVCYTRKGREYSHGHSNAFVCPSPGSCDVEDIGPDSKRPVLLIRRCGSKIYTYK